jgi:hypothetical protein
LGERHREGEGGFAGAGLGSLSKYMTNRMVITQSL